MAIGIWVTFFYFISLVVLAASAILVNRVLVKYKLRQERELSARLDEHRKLLGQESQNTEMKKAIVADIEWLGKDRETLHHMWA